MLEDYLNILIENLASINIRKLIAKSVYSYAYF